MVDLKSDDHSKLNSKHIKPYLLEARTVEPEEQPLLYNDHEWGGCTRAVSRQRLGKHVPAETNNATVLTVTIETAAP
jgi:hypothetical protein